MPNKKFLDVIETITIIFLIIFGLIVLYQLILKILGGSWITENLIISLLVVILTISFATAIKVAKLSSDHTNLKHQFHCLAKDFKSHLHNN